MPSPTPHLSNSGFPDTSMHFAKLRPPELSGAGGKHGFLENQICLLTHFGCLEVATLTPSSRAEVPPPPTPCPCPLPYTCGPGSHSSSVVPIRFLSYHTVRALSYATTNKNWTTLPWPFCVCAVWGFPAHRLGSRVVLPSLLGCTRSPLEALVNDTSFHLLCFSLQRGNSKHY